MFGNTVRGVEPYVMRQAAYACILPILTYAAPAWWPGKKRLDKVGNAIRNGVEGHLNRLNKIKKNCSPHYLYCVADNSYNDYAARSGNLSY